MSTRRNVNLNKELGNDWVGRVRKWEKRWVVCDDKSAPQQLYGVRRPLQLLKWVQTDVRTKPEASSRHPDILPVTDLSLVPGARLGTPMDAAAAAGQVADPLAAPPIQLTPMETTPSAAAAAAAPTPTAVATATGATQQQQQQQQQQWLDPLSVPTVDSGLPPVAPSAAAGAAGSSGLVLPSPSAATGSVSFDLGAAPSVSFQPGLQQLIPAAAAVTASDYTAGTDSGALGRLPHEGLTASEYTGGGDSMDVDQTAGTAGDMDDEADQEEEEEVENDEEEDYDDQGLGGDDDEEEHGFGHNDDDEDDDMPS